MDELELREQALFDERQAVVQERDALRLALAKSEQERHHTHCIEAWARMERRALAAEGERYEARDEILGLRESCNRLVEEQGEALAENLRLHEVTLELRDKWQDLHAAEKAEVARLREALERVQDIGDTEASIVASEALAAKGGHNG